MTEYVDEREKVLRGQIEDLIKKEQEERAKLLKLIEQYADMVEKLRAELEARMQALREQLELSLQTAVHRLE